MVKTLCFQRKGHGFDSWCKTKIPHAMQQSQKIKINNNKNNVKKCLPHASVGTGRGQNPAD